MASFGNTITCLMKSLVLCLSDIIILTRNGVETNIYRYMDVDSTFLQLDIGDNTFRYDADDGLSNLEVTVYFAQKYLGV